MYGIVGWNRVGEWSSSMHNIRTTGIDWVSAEDCSSVTDGRLSLVTSRPVWLKF